MNTAILFDVDNTLTPPRQLLSSKMVNILKDLTVPFHVAAGSHMDLLNVQFFQPLYSLGFRGRFNAFLSNGAIHYFCDYSSQMEIKTISKFDIKVYLGEKTYNEVLSALEETMSLPIFQLPPDIKVMSEQIVFRGSMINLCPIGRADKNLNIYYENRQRFVAFDRKSLYRLQIIEHLKNRLAKYIAKNNVTITLGGETSFDIGIVGQDKTNAVRTLLREGIQRLIFIGDALFEGGNDSTIQSYVDNWDAEAKCPLETVQVNGWKSTIDALHSLGFITHK